MVCQFECFHLTNIILNKLLLPFGAEFQFYLKDSLFTNSIYFDSVVSFTNIQGTAAGGTMEIVVNGTTGFLHPVGKEGVKPLANNIVKLATHIEKRLTMGKKGYERVKERFLEQHMSQRIAFVLKEVLQYAKTHSHS